MRENDCTVEVGKGSDGLIRLAVRGNEGDFVIVTMDSGWAEWVGEELLRQAESVAKEVKRC